MQIATAAGKSPARELAAFCKNADNDGSSVWII